MADEEAKPLDYINEIVLKKRKQNEEWAIRKRETAEAQILRRKDDQKLKFKRPEQFVRDYRAKQLDFLQSKRRQKMRRPSPISAESQLLFVVRINRSSDMHPKTRKILHLLKLRNSLSGVFLKADEKTMDLLNRVQPFVTYGIPNLKSTRDLVYKRGYLKIDKQRVPLTDNNIVEQALGKYNILCIEDIVNQISKVGPHFKDVVSSLWPFKLNKPGGELQGKKTLFKDGGDTGNRGVQINELISKMN